MRMPARLGSDDSYLMRSCRLLNLELGFRVAENTYFIKPLQRIFAKVNLLSMILLRICTFSYLFSVNRICPA